MKKKVDDDGDITERGDGLSDPLLSDKVVMTTQKTFLLFSKTPIEIHFSFFIRDCVFMCVSSSLFLLSELSTNQSGGRLLFSDLIV